MNIPRRWEIAAMGTLVRRRGLFELAIVGFDSIEAVSIASSKYRYGIIKV
ncbi:MAG: hypothetical protein WBD58_15445 [Geitlerinemataceae cyanobacterium]